MSKQVADGSKAVGKKTVKPAQRLCNEIQLFDLCEREKCRYKQGLYCTNTELLDRFEAIAEEEEERRPAAPGFISDELEDDAETSDDEYDDTYDDDQFGDEGFEEDQEDK